MDLTFVFLSLGGSSGEVGAWSEEVSSEQPMTRSPKEEDAGEVLWKGGEKLAGDW